MRILLAVMICLIPATTLAVNIADVGTSLVGIQIGTVASTGFVIGEDAWFYYVATAAHCVENTGTVLADGQEAAVLWRDRGTDAAVLMFLKADRYYRVLRLADPVLGEPVWAFGYHWVNGGEPTLVVFRGYVATEDIHGFLGTNTGLFPGLSGGPLVNAAGKVIGINSRVLVSMSLFARSAHLRPRSKEQWR